MLQQWCTGATPHRSLRSLIEGTSGALHLALPFDSPKSYLKLSGFLLAAVALLLFGGLGFGRLLLLIIGTALAVVSMVYIDPVSIISQSWWPHLSAWILYLICLSGACLALSFFFWWAFLPMALGAIAVFVFVPESHMRLPDMAVAVAVVALTAPAVINMICGIDFLIHIGFLVVPAIVVTGLRFFDAQSSDEARRAFHSIFTLTTEAQTTFIAIVVSIAAACILLDGLFSVISLLTALVVIVLLVAAFGGWSEWPGSALLAVLGHYDGGYDPSTDVLEVHRRSGLLNVIALSLRSASEWRWVGTFFAPPAERVDNAYWQYCTATQWLQGVDPGGMYSFSPPTLVPRSFHESGRIVLCCEVAFCIDIFVWQPLFPAPCIACVMNVTDFLWLTLLVIPMGFALGHVNRSITSIAGVVRRQDEAPPPPLNQAAPTTTNEPWLFACLRACRRILIGLDNKAYFYLFPFGYVFFTFLGRAQVSMQPSLAFHAISYVALLCSGIMLTLLYALQLFELTIIPSREVGEEGRAKEFRVLEPPAGKGHWFSEWKPIMIDEHSCLLTFINGFRQLLGKDEWPAFTLAHVWMPNFFNWVSILASLWNDLILFMMIPLSLDVPWCAAPLRLPFTCLPRELMARSSHVRRDIVPLFTLLDLPDWFPVPDFFKWLRIAMRYMLLQFELLELPMPSSWLISIPITLVLSLAYPWALRQALGNHEEHTKLNEVRSRMDAIDHLCMRRDHMRDEEPLTQEGLNTTRERRPELSSRIDQCQRGVDDAQRTLDQARERRASASQLRQRLQEMTNANDDSARQQQVVDDAHRTLERDQARLAETQDATERLRPVTGVVDQMSAVASQLESAQQRAIQEVHEAARALREANGSLASRLLGGAIGGALSGANRARQGMQDALERADALELTGLTTNQHMQSTLILARQQLTANEQAMERARADAQRDAAEAARRQRMEDERALRQQDADEERRRQAEADERARRAEVRRAEALRNREEARAREQQMQQAAAAAAAAATRAQAQAREEALAQATAVQLQAEARARAEAEVTAQAEAAARAQAEGRVQAEAEARAQAEAETRAQEERAQAEARAVAEAEARVPAEVDAQAQAEEQARAQAETQLAMAPTVPAQAPAVAPVVPAQAPLVAPVATQAPVVPPVPAEVVIELSSGPAPAEVVVELSSGPGDPDYFEPVAPAAAPAPAPPGTPPPSPPPTPPSDDERGVLMQARRTRDELLAALLVARNGGSLLPVEEDQLLERLHDRLNVEMPAQSLVLEVRRALTERVATLTAETSRLTSEMDERRRAVERAQGALEQSTENADVLRRQAVAEGVDANAMQRFEQADQEFRNAESALTRRTGEKDAAREVYDRCAAKVAKLERALETLQRDMHSNDVAIRDWENRAESARQERIAQGGANSTDAEEAQRLEELISRSFERAGQLERSLSLIASVLTDVGFGIVMRILLAVFTCTGNQQTGTTCDTVLEHWTDCGCYDNVLHRLMAGAAVTSLIVLLPAVVVARNYFQEMQSDKTVRLSQRHLLMLFIVTTILLITATIFPKADDFSLGGWHIPAKLVVSSVASLMMLCTLPFFKDSRDGVLNACTWRPILISKGVFYLTAFVLSLGAIAATLINRSFDGNVRADHHERLVLLS